MPRNGESLTWLVLPVSNLEVYQNCHWVTAVPAVRLLPCVTFCLSGTGVLILSPTRELAMQTFGVLKELMTHHVHTYGLIMGGSNRSAEAQKLGNGINIIVATPGRLLDHMQVRWPWDAAPISLPCVKRKPDGWHIFLCLCLVRIPPGLCIKISSVWWLMRLIVSWMLGLKRN